MEPYKKNATIFFSFIANVMTNDCLFTRSGQQLVPLFDGVITKEPSGALNYVISFPSTTRIHFFLNLKLTTNNLFGTFLLFSENVTWPYIQYLDTDYATYDIVYGCSYYNGIYQGNVVLVFSRFCNFRPNILVKAARILAKSGVTDKLITYAAPRCCQTSSSTSVTESSDTPSYSLSINMSF